MKKDAYHTALRSGKIEDATPCDSFESDGVKAFSWDLMLGWSGRHHDAEAVYMEIPWPGGFRVFEERAGFGNEDDRSYRRLIQKVADMVLDFDGPVAIVHPTKIAKEWRGDFRHYKSQLDGHGKGHECGITIWGDSAIPMGTSDEVLIYLVNHYGKIADAACGYGRTGKVVKAMGGECILSDYNRNCIGYIRDHWSTWP